MFFGGNRELLARSLYWTGAASFVATLPARDVLLVLNYHRIGDPDEDLYDPAVFSATSEQFDSQVEFLKRKTSVVTLEEALSYIEGRDRSRSPRCRVLITFDDGYLDNYRSAFPVLRAHGVQGVFFLVTAMVGACEIPWWDRIAYLVKTARRRQFSLRYPADLAVNLDRAGVAPSIREVLRLYKRPDNHDPERFLSELSAAAQSLSVPVDERRFLNWQEAREMIDGGMAVGSHTRSHPVLSQLGAEAQLRELSESRAQLEQQLGVAVEALAYPVGTAASFSAATGEMARAAGYRAAFSFYGGTNLPGSISAFDVKRVGVDRQSAPRFKVQTAVCKLTGSHWP